MANGSEDASTDERRCEQDERRDGYNDGSLLMSPDGNNRQ